MTFAGRGGGAHTGQWARFACAGLVGACVNVGTYLALTGTMALLDRHRLLALLAGCAAAASINFALACRWVFPAPATRRGPAR